MHLKNASLFRVTEFEFLIKIKMFNLMKEGSHFSNCTDSEKGRDSNIEFYTVQSIKTNPMYFREAPEVCRDNSSCSSTKMCCDDNICRLKCEGLVFHSHFNVLYHFRKKDAFLLLCFKLLWII